MKETPRQARPIAIPHPRHSCPPPRAAHVLCPPLRRESQARIQRSSPRWPKEGLPTSPGDHRAGDVVLVPRSAAIRPAFGFLMAGGVIRSVAVGPDAGFFRDARARDHALSIPKAHRGLGLLSVEPDRPPSPIRLLQGASAVPRRSTALYSSPTLAYAEVYFAVIRPHRVLQVPFAMSCSSIHLDVQDLFDAGLRNGICVGNERISSAPSGPREILSSTMRCFTPIQSRRPRPERPRRLQARRIRETYSAAATWLAKASARAWCRCRRPAASRVRLVSDPDPFKDVGRFAFSKRLVGEARGQCRPHRASASAAKASFFSRSFWRTNSASGQRQIAHVPFSLKSRARGKAPKRSCRSRRRR